MQRSRLSRAVTPPSPPKKALADFIEIALKPLFPTEEDRSLRGAIKTARLGSQLCIVTAHRGARKSTTLTRLQLRGGFLNKIIVVRSASDLWKTLQINADANSTAIVDLGKSVKTQAVTAVGSLLLYSVAWYFMGVAPPWQAWPTPVDLVAPLAPLLPFMISRLSQAGDRRRRCSGIHFPKVNR